MENSQKNTLPLFYSEEYHKTESGYETVQDFNLKWILYCAVDGYQNIDSKLYEYARRAVFLLIYGNRSNNEKKYIPIFEIPPKFKVVNMVVKRQWKHIDLVAEVDVTISDIPVQEKYVLSIENKYYSNIKPGQLEKYKDSIDKEYKGKVDKDKLINLCILCDEVKYENALPFCKDNNYRLLTIEDIKYWAIMDNVKTGNALFDEYWFNLYKEHSVS